MYSSSDLKDWKLKFTGVDDDIMSVWGEPSKGVAFAVTQSGTILASENGISWVGVHEIGFGGLHDISYEHGIFLIRSGFNDVYSLGLNYLYSSYRYERLSHSRDGINWETIKLSAGNLPDTYDGFVFNGDVALAVSRAGHVFRSRGGMDKWGRLGTRFPDVKHPYDSSSSSLRRDRLGLELYDDGTSFWARSIEKSYVLLPRSTMYSNWYRSDDDGESWTYVSDAYPSSIPSTEIRTWPFKDWIGQIPSGDEASKGTRISRAFAFGRNIRVGDDYRIELSNVVAFADRTRLVNLSARAYAGEGDATLIAGFVTSANEEYVDLGGPDVLLRGVGPSLKLLDSNLSDESAKDPSLTLFRGQEVEATNYDYEDGVKTSFAQTGAFDLLEMSKDTALTANVGAGLFSAHVTDSEGGIALAEVYRIPNVGIELENLSARAVVSGGGRTLIGGFVLEGESVRTIMIRGVGPGLDLEGILEDPAINLYRGSELIASNDNWGGNVFF